VNAGPAPLLVATDLDGTIVRTDGTIGPRTVEMIGRLEALGTPFVMVTGRPPRWMAPIAEQTGHRGLAVCANGALLYDLHTERVVRAHLIDASAAAEVVRGLRKALPGVAFAIEKGPVDGVPGGFAREDVYVARFDVANVRVEDLDEMLSGGAAKLLARHESLDSDAMLAAARDALGDTVELTHSSGDGLLEISAAGITKASGLAAFAEQLGIEATDVIAFGDMPNDLPMLSWAGRSVGMANAHPDVLALVDEVTLSNDDDGVVRVLERWFPAA
jgi:hypothetical protein